VARNSPQSPEIKIQGKEQSIEEKGSIGSTGKATKPAKHKFKANASHLR
jgi:hypothetical protein